MSVIGLIALIAAAIIISKKLLATDDSGKPDEIIYCTKLHESIERIAFLDREIQKVDNMLQNLTMGQSKNALNRMTVSWDWAGTNKEQTTFNAWDGEATQQKLRELAYAKRSQLCSSLSDEIKKMPLRRTQNGGTTLMNDVMSFIDEQEKRM